MNHRFENLKEYVIDASESKQWEDAKTEWVYNDRLPDQVDICYCGTPIKARYRILNKLNGNCLGPIGSTCIKRFQEEELLLGMEEGDRCFCKPCNIPFESIEHLEAHLKESCHHIRIRWCKKCRKKYDRTEDELEDLFTHCATQMHEKNLKIRRCKECGRSIQELPSHHSKCLKCWKKEKCYI